MELTLKNNIEQKLQENGMKLVDLMELVAVSLPKLKGIIAGGDVKVSDALKIAAAFGCELSDIWQQVFSVKEEEEVKVKKVLTFS